MAEFLIRTILPVADALNNDQTAGWELFGTPDRTGAAGAELCTDVRSWMSDTRSRRGSALLRQERTEAAGIFSRSRHRLDSVASHHLVLAAPSHACREGGLGELDTGQEETKIDAGIKKRLGENVTEEKSEMGEISIYWSVLSATVTSHVPCVMTGALTARKGLQSPKPVVTP